MMKKETLRLSNSISMSERLYDVCKSGWMTKRSQNKKRFTPINYKLRWFELTKQNIYYFDIENVEVMPDFSFVTSIISIFVYLHFSCVLYFSFHYRLLKATPLRTAHSWPPHFIGISMAFSIAHHNLR